MLRLYLAGNSGFAPACPQQTEMQASVTALRKALLHQV
jgi:hypothetical protein